MADGRVCVVMGVGPGLGAALVRRFTEAGFRVVGVSRNSDYACDVTDEAQIVSVLQRIRTELGPIHTLLWNVGSGIWGDVDQIDATGMDLAYHTNTRGLFVAAQQVVGDMRGLDGGNIVVTGATASRRGKPFTTAFAAGKAAQRSLCESLARKLWPEGIHVALIVVDGGVGDGEGKVHPDGYADTALFLCGQDRSAWTFELEVRPHVEAW